MNTRAELPSDAVATLLATRQTHAWQVRLDSSAVTAAAAPELAQVEGRGVAWRLARNLGKHPSPWDIEYQKAALGPPEVTMGYARLLARACNDHGQPAGTVRLPVAVGLGNVRTAVRELVACGVPAARGPFTASLDRAQFSLATALAGLAFMAYVLRRGRGAPPQFAGGPGSYSLAAHGEWSTRTQHVLGDPALHDASVLLLIGRLRESPATVARRLREEHGLRLPPILHPLSISAALRAVPRTLRQLVCGLRDAPRRHYRPTLREQAAISFRVMLGLATQCWWEKHGPTFGTVVFAHTGMADTSLLEQVMQQNGTRTIHAVHGLATGPNFAGWSTLGLFRCGFDARSYESLGAYGRCIVQEAGRPARLRGAEGVYLLTNLAHPMNPGFIARGAQDEIALLRLVAAAAGSLGPAARKLVWRPHPVIRRLRPEIAAEIRAEASRLGFEVQDMSEPMTAAAARARWVITSPSTTAVDLLGHGALPVVLDPQKTTAGTAPACFPTCAPETLALAALMRELDSDAAYEARFRQTWDAVLPARPLDVSALLLQ